jgi:hypothetical protein
MLATFTLSRPTSTWLALGLRLKRPLVQVALLFALLLAVVPGSQAQAEDNQVADAQWATIDHLRLAQQSTPDEPIFPENGQYLFGQVPQRDQLGQGYIVLESSGEQVFGALYYPSSSFDCFQGQLQSGQLAMSITNSYTQETYPYSIALTSDTAVATTVPDSLQPLSLEGFHRINSLNENDLRLLNTCRAVVTPES